MPVLFKLVDLESAQAQAALLRRQGRRLVLTNGCFDLLHPGHIVHLQQARDVGDALLVALNSDRSVREIKGPLRPVYDETQRVLALSALQCVDYVLIFDEPEALGVIEQVRPDLYVKGGDYTLDSLNQAERALLQRLGVEIRLLPQVENFSTTNVIHRVQYRPLEE